MRIIKFAHFTVYAERPERCAQELLASLGDSGKLLEAAPESNFFLGSLGNKGVTFEVIPPARVVRMTHGIYPVARATEAVAERALGASLPGYSAWGPASCKAVTLLSPPPGDETVAVIETADLERCLQLWNHLGFRLIGRSGDALQIDAKFPLNRGRIGLRLISAERNPAPPNHTGIGLIGLCTTHLQEAHQELAAFHDLQLSEILHAEMTGRTIDYFYVTTAHCQTLEIYSMTRSPIGRSG